MGLRVQDRGCFLRIVVNLGDLGDSELLGFNVDLGIFGYIDSLGASRVKFSLPFNLNFHE